MNLLQYTSKEMYSSTDLIRKSKNIFDKLNKKEIEKAVILRDGKPSFMLMDFETYEEIMIEYMNLKQNSTSNKNTQSGKIYQPSETIIEEEPILEDKNSEKLNDEELQKALAEIDNLDFSLPTEDNKKETPLKEFWE